MPNKRSVVGRRSSTINRTCRDPASLAICSAQPSLNVRAFDKYWKLRLGKNGWSMPNRRNSWATSASCSFRRSSGGSCRYSGFAKICMPTCWLISLLRISSSLPPILAIITVMYMATMTARKRNTALIRAYLPSLLITSRMGSDSTLSESRAVQIRFSVQLRLPRPVSLQQFCSPTPGIVSQFLHGPNPGIRKEQAYTKLEDYLLNSPSS